MEKKGSPSNTKNIFPALKQGMYNALGMLLWLRQRATFVKVARNLKKENSEEIMENVKLSVRIMPVEQNWAFLHDDDPKHNSHLVNNLFEKYKVKYYQPVLVQSQVLNVIESCR
jgi:hypothetical protein